MAVVADYEIDCLIGKGSQSSFFKAKWRSEWVALKIMDIFDDRATGYSSISHPNVLNVREYFNTDDGTCIVLPLMEAGSIRSIVKYAFPNGMRERFGRVVLFNVLVGLKHIHRLGGVYGNKIHLGKFLVSREGSVKLAPSNSLISSINGVAEMLSVQQQEVFDFGVAALELACGALSEERLPVRFSELNLSPWFCKIINSCLHPIPSERGTARMLLGEFSFNDSPDNYLLDNAFGTLPPLEERLEYDTRSSIFAARENWNFTMESSLIEATRAAAPLIPRASVNDIPEEQQESKWVVGGFFVSVFLAIIGLVNLIIGIVKFTKNH